MANNKPFIISIEGNICCGKTKVLKLLKEFEADFNLKNKIVYIDESWSIVDDNFDIINNYHLNTSNIMHCGQLLKMFKRFQDLQQVSENLDNRLCIMERSFQTQKYVFSKFLDKNCPEINIYLYFLKYVLQKSIEPSLYIYIRSKPEVVFERLQNKRPEEDNITLEYLIELHNLYESWLFLESNVIILDGEQNEEQILVYLAKELERVYSVNQSVKPNSLIENKFDKPVIISIEGNIGSGKSTIVKLLKENEEFKNIFKKSKKLLCVEEPVKKWTNVNGFDILDAYYKNPKLSHVFQYLVMLTVFEEIENALSIPDVGLCIFERSFQTQKNVFMHLLKKNSLKTDVCDYFLKYFLEKSIEPSLYIYIQCNPTVVYDRVRKRNRTAEDSISLQYLTTLHELHESWLTFEKNVVVINGEREENEVVKDIINILSEQFKDQFKQQTKFKFPFLCK
jgi:deoxyadenosine/deoxycytidine kinase